ncbi:MAG: energy transducer TonB [bacterium]
MSDRITIGSFIISLVFHGILFAICLSISPPEPEQEMVIEIAFIEIESLPPVEEKVIKEEEPPSTEPEPEPKSEPEPILKPEPSIQKEMPLPPAPEPIGKKPSPLREVLDVPFEGDDLEARAREGKEEAVTQDMATNSPVYTSQPQSPKTEGAEGNKKTRDSFFHLVKKKIEAVKSYPGWAKRQGFEGVVKVEFTIRQEGEIDNIRIVKSSGYRILDKAALATIKRACPFPKPPSDLGEKLKITVPIVYRLLEE